MHPPRLAHVFVFASDLERLAAFYVGAFGLRREDSVDSGFVLLRGAGADVALHRLPPHLAETTTIASPAVWREDSALKFCFDTPDLPAQRAAILAHGGQAKEPWSWDGTDFCECADPEGNPLQLFHRATP